MEFYLLKDKLVEMATAEHANDPEKYPIWSDPVPINLEPVAERIVEGNGYLEYLIGSLVEDDSYLKGCLQQRSLHSCLEVYMMLTGEQNGSVAEEQKGIVQIHGTDGDVDSYDVGSSDGCEDIFRRFADVFGSSNVKFSFKMSDFIYKEQSATPRRRQIVLRDVGIDCRIEDRDLEIIPIAEDPNSSCILHQLVVPNQLRQPWVQGIKFTANLTVTVNLSHQSVNKMFLHQYFRHNLSEANRWILQQAICSDMVIVASNGAQLKCHKVFLAGKSKVFMAMFQSEMQETIKHSIEMPDMSEAGVRAFLAFIYYWDVQEASKSCKVAFELLQAGHKYNIGTLEKGMEQLLAFKPNDWFSLEVAVRIFIYKSNLSNDDTAEPTGVLLKSIKVLKWYNQMHPEKTSSSDEYQLLTKNEKCAKQLAN